MREQLEHRLAELQGELSVGERKLREIEGQQAHLRDTLLRIDGAIHVLREMLVQLDQRGEATDVSRTSVLSAAIEGNGSGASAVQR